MKRRSRRSGPMGRALGALLFLLAAATAAFGQPRGGILRGRIVNGTTGAPAERAERVALLRLAGGMEAIVTRENVPGSFVLEGFEVEGERPYLLQVTYQGVNYNEPVRFGRGYEAEAEVTVYEATRDPAAIEIATARYLFRRSGDRLLVDKLWLVRNRTSPPKTYHDPEGTFRFFLPTEGLRELRGVSATSSSGMPVPQPASPTGDGETYVVRTAFKPGETTLTVSYEVDYSSEAYRIAERVLYPLPEMMILVSPPDVRIEADPSWQRQTDPEGRVVILGRANLAPGEPVAIDLANGSATAPDLLSSSEGSAGAAGGSREDLRVTTLPDPTRAEKWILALLLGAALAWALLTALYGAAAKGEARGAGSKEGGVERALAELERRRAAGEVSKKAYRRRRRELEERLERTAGRTRS